MNFTSIKRYINLRSVLVIGCFVAVAHLGARYQDQLKLAANNVLPKNLELVTDPQTIYAIWIGILTVHAAVGALAPILGYTLLATSVTNASRIAPSGAVVAAEIEWSRYLQTSLLLLAGSIAAMLAAPSILGVTAAAFAVSYVLARTLYVFKTGFELIERPEKFDIAARQYLTAAVRRAVPDPLNKSLRLELDELNDAFENNLQRGGRSGSMLYLGSNLHATQLLRIKKRSLETLNSEAEKLGYQLHLVGWKVPGHLPRGAREFLVVAPAGADIFAGTDEIPTREKDHASVAIEHLSRLQAVLEDGVVFGRGAWVEDLVRAPMLVRRHIATVLYESIPREQPHDLEYGLDVLGQVIDDVQATAGNGTGLDLQKFEWIYDVPQFLCGQISRATHAKLLYARELANFIRARLIKWFQDPELDSVSRAYLSILRRLLSMFLSDERSSAEYFAMTIRELPILDRSGRLDVLRMIHRELVLLLITKRNGRVLDENCRRLIIRTIQEVARFSTNYRGHHVVRAEAVISALAVAMFLAESDSDYEQHVSNITEILLRQGRDEPEFSELLSVAGRVEEIVEAWRWTWWELEQKERGEAHFLSMETWLTRSVIVAMSADSWQLLHLKEEEIPDQQYLGRLQRSLRASEWTKHLPETLSKAVEKTNGILKEVSAKRERYVEERIRGAALDKQKLRSHTQGVISEVLSTFGAYNEWLHDSAVIFVDESAYENPQYGISRLLPRECFVSEDVLDIPVSISGTEVGSSLIDFEAKKVAELLSAAGVVRTPVGTPNDGRIWSYVRELLSADDGPVWIIAEGVSQYDAYESISGFQDDLRNKKLRFDTLNASHGQQSRVIVFSLRSSIRVVRAAATEQEGAVRQEALSLSRGGVMCAIAEISDSMQRKWISAENDESAEEMKAKYASSVLERIAWSFRIELQSTSSCRLFVLDSSEERQ